MKIVRMKKGENVMMTERNAKNARPRMERRKRMKSRADIIPVALENLKGLKGLRGLTSYPRSQKRRQLKDLPRNQRNLLRNHPRMWTSSLISGKKSNPAAKRKFPRLLLLPRRVRKKNPEVAATTMMINTGVIVDTVMVIAVRRVTVIVTGRGGTRKERRGNQKAPRSKIKEAPCKQIWRVWVTSPANMPFLLATKFWERTPMFEW